MNRAVRRGKPAFHLQYIRTLGEQRCVKLTQMINVAFRNRDEQDWGYYEDD
jgi:hypothetical protein